MLQTREAELDARDMITSGVTRTRFADLGLDVAAREQRTPEGLAAFQEAEIVKWWRIIKAAGIKPE